MMGIPIIRHVSTRSLDVRCPLCKGCMYTITAGHTINERIYCNRWIEKPRLGMVLCGGVVDVYTMSKLEELRAQHDELENGLDMSDPSDMTDIDDLNDSVDRIVYASRAQLENALDKLYRQTCEEFPGLEEEWGRRRKEDPDIGFLDVAAEMEERRNKK